MNGQAKIDFEKWLMDGNDGVSNFCRTIELTRFHFLALKETCQLALIIEWFDTLDTINFQEILLEEFKNNYLMYPLNSIFKESLEKAIILYNEKFKENDR